MSGNASLGFCDLSLQFGHRVLRTTALCDLANDKPRGLKRFQHLAVLFELNAMPRDLAVAVATHDRTPDSPFAHHDTAAVGGVRVSIIYVIAGRYGARTTRKSSAR
jgi:hypothetical protein